MTGPDQRPGGRRAAVRRRGLNLTAALALVLPALAAAALTAVRPGEEDEPARPPARTPLTATTLVCPQAPSGAGELALAAPARVAGTVRVGLGARSEDVRVRAGRVSTVDANEPLAVFGEGTIAPGLVAGRGGGSTAALTSCGAPVADQWFTGVAAGAERRSTLELTNPDAGTAVADVTVLGSDGVVEAPALRGVSVPGGSTVRLDLGDVVPREDDLALHVVVSRGRLGASVLDRRDPVGPRKASADWIPAQAAPAERAMLLGAVGRAASHHLTIANPGTSEVRARVRVVGADAVFTPEGLDPIRVPPASVVTVPVTAVVGDAVSDGGLGLQVTASGPVTSLLRSVAAQDVSYAAPTEAVATAATVVLPTTSGPDLRVLLAGASRAGAVTVRARGADGGSLLSKEVDIVPGRGLSVAVPRETRLVTVTPARTSVVGVVVASSRAGAAVLPLTVPPAEGLVPDVRPGLP